MTAQRGVVPENIRAEMARRGVSQSRLADALGISQQAVSQKLTGRRPITTEEIAAIAAVLDVTPGILFATTTAKAVAS